MLRCRELCFSELKNPAFSTAQFGGRYVAILQVKTTNNSTRTMNPSLRPFEHRKLKAHPPLIGSYCRACGAFIAASTGKAMLRLAEEAHGCPKKLSNRPRTRPSK
jgi:hypothetical protein